MDEKNKPYYKNISIWVAALILPGGFIALGAYYLYSKNKKEEKPNKGESND